jgi:hypothetical protein
MGPEVVFLKALENMQEYWGWTYASAWVQRWLLYKI